MSIIKKQYRRIVNKCLIQCVYPLWNFFYELFHKDYTILTASVNPLYHNWGDDMSLQLCSLINPDRKFIISRYTWNLFKHDNFLCIGSIITWMTTPNSIIWGSGIVYSDKELSAKPQRVLAVRGPLTRQYLLKRGVECPEVYGDPALLFPRFYQPSVEKKFRLGIVPHFRDKKNSILEKFSKDPSVKIIDVQNVHPWTKFIDDICSCECIASSSLHGIIVSDAYNVPNVWVEFSEGERKQFAFQDYFGSVDKDGQEATPVSVTTTKEDLIQQCENWKAIKIDLDLLMSVCPFKYK